MQEAAQSAADSAKNAALEVAKKTQEELDRMTAKARDAVNDVVNDTRQAGQEAAEKIRGALEDTAATFKGKADEAMDNAARTVSALTPVQTGSTRWKPLHVVLR